MILFGEPLNSGKPITILPSTDTIENLMDMRRDTFYDSVASMPPSSVPVNFNIKIGDSATPPNARHFNALYLVGQNIGQFDLLNGSTSVLVVLNNLSIDTHSQMVLCFVNIFCNSLQRFHRLNSP